MDPRLIDQRRYLAALRAAMVPQPDAHRGQLAALEREQALASSSDDPEACRRASGDLFELARAAWLDRLLNHARVAAALDDPWTVQAAAIEIDATLGARGHADWTDALQAGSTRAAIWHHRAAEVKSGAAALVMALTRAAWDRRPAAQAELRATAEAAWAQWSALEPASREVSGLLARPRYRLRTPWTGDGARAGVALIANAALPEAAAIEADAGDGAAILAGIEDALARWRAGLPHVTPGPIVSGEPEVADVVGPYAGLVNLPAEAPATAALVKAARAMVAAAQGARTAQGVMAAWTEAGFLTDLAAAPVRAHAETVLARAAIWADPLLAAGARALLADLSGSRTGCDVDLISTHHGACAAIEADWNQALAGALLAPIEAAAIAGWDPTSAPSIAAAWQVARMLAGVGGALIDQPRVRAVLALIAGRDALPPDLGAFLGEIGHAVVGEARTWWSVGKLAPRTAADVAALLRTAWGPVPDGAARPVRLWGVEVALDDLDRPPPRPPVPGRSGTALP